ncbi:hypothetical protein, partial [Vibrio pectenicida]
IIILSGCSNINSNDQNTVDIDVVEKTIEFVQVGNDDVNLNVRKFVKELSEKDAKFDIKYNSDSSEAINDIRQIFNDLGLKYYSYKFSLIDDLDSKKIIISAKYFVIRNKDCKDIGFLQGESYKFGCIVEYNRVTSLVNPI